MFVARKHDIRKPPRCSAFLLFAGHARSRGRKPAAVRRVSSNRLAERRKELLVLASGKNVAPVYLESLLLEEPLIAQILVVGDHRSFLSALLVPDFELLKKTIQEQEWMEECDLEQTWPAVLTEPHVIKLFSNVIACQLAEVSHHEQVRRFALLSQPFSIDRGEVTAKLSLRREVIGEHFTAQIEAMYGADWCGPVVTVE